MPAIATPKVLPATKPEPIADWSKGESSKTDGTTTNVWIARTVKSAMADILTGP
ncbi:hypothetical protein AUP68_11830 [Ilyonectria robusta]